MKLSESQAKALKEAAYKSEHDRNYGNGLDERLDAFKAGAHYIAPIIYTQAINDVIDKIENNWFFNGIPSEYEVADFVRKHFSTELKSLENGGGDE